MRESSILNAAVALFVEKGLGSTSVDDILRKSGVAKGTFYYYFKETFYYYLKEKSDLIDRVHDLYTNIIADIVDSEMNKHKEGDWRSRLKTWIRVLVLEFLDPGTLYYDLLYDRLSYHSISHSEQPLVRQLADLLDNGSSRGIWAVERPIPTAICIVHALHGLVDNARTICTPATEIVIFSYRLFLKILYRDDGRK